MDDANLLMMLFSMKWACRVYTGDDIIMNHQLKRLFLLGAGRKK